MEGIVATLCGPRRVKHLPAFQTELFYARYEFSCPHLLSASDCETMSVGELLEMAGVSSGELLDVRLGYTQSQGDQELRGMVASRYSELDAEGVLILGSPIEGLFLLANTFQGETVVLTPAYDALKNLPRNLQRWDLKATPGGWRLDFDQLEQVADPETELLVVNFPHNPTGFIPSPEEWDRLIEWVAERQIWLFCDEMYAGLQRADQPAWRSALDRYSRTVILGGLSKSHGLPGLRCGWLASRDRRLLRHIHDLKMYTSICPPGPTEALARVALSVEEKLVARSNRIIERNLGLADDFFARHGDEFVWRRPPGASVALVELRAKESAREWCEGLAQKHGVVLLPGTFLGCPDRFVRFGFGRESFASSLGVLESVLAG